MCGGGGGGGGGGDGGRRWWSRPLVFTVKANDG